MAKKLNGFLITILITLFLAGPAMAAWTLTPSMLHSAGKLIKWRVVCTSDGDALTATDLIALMGNQMKFKVSGSILTVMNVYPGAGAVIPNTTINVTLTNDEGRTVYAATAFSKDAVTAGNDLSEDYSWYIPVYGYLGLALNDIGDSGDQVTLEFEAYIP